MGKWRQSSILAELRNEITGGTFLPGARLPTLDAMQARFQVSRHTVQGAMRQLARDGFVCARRALGSHVSQTPPHLYHYGLVSAERFSDSRYTGAMQRVAAELTEDGPIRFSTYWYDRGHIQSEGYRRLMADVEARRLAGLIFVWPPFRLDGTPALEQKGLPRVMTSAPGGYPDIPRLTFDHAAFLAQAVAYLRRQGRKRIALIAPYLQAKDMAVDLAYLVRRRVGRPEWVQACDSRHPWSACQAARLLMALPAKERPDGLIVGDDHLVEAAAEGLAAVGVRIPQDLAVVAHCNFPDRPPACVPVTWLGLDCRSLVQRCVENLTAQRQGRKVPQITVLPPVFEADRQIGPFPAEAFGLSWNDRTGARLVRRALSRA